MAVIGTDQEEQDPNAPPGTPGTGGGTGGGGTGGSGYLGGGSGQGATTTAAPSTPAGFTNLSSYLSANQGSAGQMANAVTGSIANTGQKADQLIDSYKSGGTAAAKNGGTAVNQGTVNAITDGASTVDANTMAKISGGFDPTTGKYSGPGSVDASYKGPDAPTVADYSGPNDVSSMSGQAGADRNAYQGLKDVLTGKLNAANGGQSGVAGLETSMFQQPSYTSGENNLDAFLTGGSSAYQQGLANANDKWGGEAAKAATADAAVTDAIGAAKQVPGAARAAYNTAYGNAQNQSNSTQKIYDEAIKSQMAKAAAWKPPTPPPTPPTPNAGTPPNVAGPVGNAINGMGNKIGATGANVDPSTPTGRANVLGAGTPIVFPVGYGSFGGLSSSIASMDPTTSGAGSWGGLAGFGSGSFQGIGGGVAGLGNIGGGLGNIGGGLGGGVGSLGNVGAAVPSFGKVIDQLNPSKWG